MATPFLGQGSKLIFFSLKSLNSWNILYDFIEVTKIFMKICLEHEKYPYSLTALVYSSIGNSKYN